MDKIWILTEEKPKISVIRQIIAAYCSDFDDCMIESKDIQIRPVFKNGVFEYYYVVDGIAVSKASEIIIKTVSGNSSFLDFLLFKQEIEPSESGSDKPLMGIEETKTSDYESRNTGVYQRGSKFVFIDAFYRSVKLYMLYNDELTYSEDKKPSDTSIFGTNILLTLGVRILGKQTSRWFSRFNSIDDLILFKTHMRRPPAGNVPIDITKSSDAIYISGRLAKPALSGNIGHDPNIGALSMISKCLRVLGWEKRIVITQHAVSQDYVSKTHGNNKFLYICYLLNLEMAGIRLPVRVSLPENYWHYELSSEKMASILLHVQCENAGMKEVYQNHAGCERGYFKTPNGELLALPKKDQNGENLLLPDVVLWDPQSNMIVMVEGKKLLTMADGIREIKLYSSIEKEFINKYYPNSSVYKGVSIYGGYLKELPCPEVMFYLNRPGLVCVNSNAPECIKNAFKAI